MLGLSLHGWENAMVVFLIIAGGFALLAGAATWAVVRLQRAEIERSEAALEKYKLDTAKDISESNARALEAQLALEKFKAPRELSIEQKDKLAGALKAFAGQEYALSLATGIEAENLLCSIDEVLQKAKWLRVGPFGVINVDTGKCGSVGVNSLSGVHLRVAPTSTIEMQERVKAFMILLIAEGIATEAALDPKNIPSATAIQIMVGIKP